MKRTARFPGGFSLIEVTLSIGILAFTVIPLVGLLCIGLQSERDARDGNAASRILSLAEASLLAAKENPDGGFSAGMPLEALSWQQGEAAVAGPVYFDQDTKVVPTAGEARYALRVRFSAAADALQPVSLVVAWPASATVAWGEDGHAQIQKAEGSGQHALHLPRP